MYRICVLNSHPIQYFAPLYRRINQTPDIEVVALYCSRAGLEPHSDSGFGAREVPWDIDLTTGYESVFMPNRSICPEIGRFWGLLNPGVMRELAQRRPDALWVHGHGYATHLLAVASARALGIPVLMRNDTHLALSRPPFRRALRQPVMRALYSQIEAFLAVGTRNREFYRSLGISDRRIFHVPYTVDNERFAKRTDGAAGAAALWEEYGLDPGLPLVLFVSKLVPGKRPADLLHALRTLRHDNVPWQALFIGGGELESRLRAIARGDPHIHFIGFQNQSVLPAWYAAASVFVAPYVNEAWGLVVNEAMASGTPVIASEELGCAPDLIVEGKTGYLYPAGDVDALTHALRTVLSDPALLETLSANTQRHMETWSYDQTIAGLREALSCIRRR